ncbi:AraC-like DNA-binding protein [Chitinophaga polysaccharea]|uniref:AraC-like DNA-binding protein n=1 Tax=Chitinophaga polysaccharea TaxID=1293035 RepID=A0A561PC51_9BACT|nr:helix-turn-helix transcriptional regulator [Chitinophaga polysaccharea]TWF35704.1 AraC-like DNA-binding protein [Chitinophaga polysaccharea]
MKSGFPVYDICKFSVSQQQDVIISQLGPYLAALQKLHFPHRHDFYHLVLFTAGGGSHSIDFQNFLVQPFQFYFMAPGQVHSWSFEGEIDGFVINFRADFFKSFLLNPDYLDQFPFLGTQVDHSVIEIPVDSRPVLIDLLNRAVLESENKRRFRVDTIRVMLLQLFLLIGEINTSEKYQTLESSKSTLLKRFEKLIEHNYLELRRPKQYADILCVTPNYLNAVCNDVLGTSAGDIIRNRIVLEAKRKLINLNVTVTEIAYSLNFEDNSYFCKFFKKQTGLSPNSFRSAIH